MKLPDEVLAEGQASRRTKISMCIVGIEKWLIAMLQRHPQATELQLFEEYDGPFPPLYVREDVIAELCAAGYSAQFVKTRRLSFKRDHILISGWIRNGAGLRPEIPNLDSLPYRDPPAHCPTCGALKEGAKP